MKSTQLHIKGLVKIVLWLIIFNPLHTAYTTSIHFTDIDGLPRNIINCIEQDKYGYLWIGTGNGIARYDGQDFFIHDELSTQGVIDIINDSNNNLWVATSQGLYKLNRLTNVFELVFLGYVSKLIEYQREIYFLQSMGIKKVEGDTLIDFYSSQNLTDFCFSQEGLWFITTNEAGRNLHFQPNANKLKKTFLENNNPSYITMIGDKLFIGCYNGEVYTLSKEKGEVKKIMVDNHSLIKKIVKKGSDYWIATDGNGILILDDDLKLSRTMNRNQVNVSDHLISNSIYDILIGVNTETWLATYGAGLICIIPDNDLFLNVLPEKGQQNSLVANEGISVTVNKPFFYFGTNYGLSVWDENTNQYYNFSADRLQMELSGIKASAILEDNNYLWIATYDGLLGKYNKQKKLIDTYHPCTPDGDEMQQTVLLKKAGKNNLLIGTHYPNRQLLNFHIETEKAEVFELFFKGSGRTYYLLNSLRKNQHGELLALISDFGLLHVDQNSSTLINKLDTLNQIIDCNISDFYHDKQGRYWLTSSTDGLLCISEKGKGYQKWTMNEGLPSNTLLRIESVDDRFLWISSINGLSRFDIETEETRNFNFRDGLPANEFLDRASATTEDGRIVFGSVAGFTLVNPAYVQPDTSINKVIISDIRFQNTSIRNKESKPYLSKPLEETTQISLPYEKNSFSIHFFVQEKSFIKSRKYSYRLVGLVDIWTYLGETNHINFTNLSPGTYTFEVVANDSKDAIANPTKLIIHIQTPWYLSWYAYLLYVAIGVTLLFLALYAYLKRVQLMKEKEISEFKIKKEQELTENKLAFFTSISHDLKTPLTLIDAPVSDLISAKNLDDEQRHKLLVIKKNSRRLYKLIVDILDFRKINKKQHSLAVRKIDINPIIDEIYFVFEEECKNKSIAFEKVNPKQIYGFVDAKKVEKIIWNLLSNALKFTLSGGTIKLCAEEDMRNGNRMLRVRISDTGVGIEIKDQPKIFDRFYQVNQSGNTAKEGSGIGLSIVKELTDLHHGEILLDSIPGQGTTFTIFLPLDKTSYADEELIAQEQFQDNRVSEPEENEIDIDRVTTEKTRKYNQATLLIVEDNTDLRNYLFQHFQSIYKVHQATDGVEGLQKANELIPDLILTDVQMPEMDGYSFCSKIRQQFETSHIPVVMLTANSTTENQVEGLSTGADAYITKPFDIKLLDTTLYTILENRKRLRRKLLKTMPLDVPDQLPGVDMEFIENLKKFIEENIISEKLNVELIAKNFAVSSSKLNRKIKSLMDTTPNNLIKSIRLAKAYELLKGGNVTVAEAAYQTGFSDPNYFTSCFKKQFGENPSQVSSSFNN